MAQQLKIRKLSKHTETYREAMHYFFSFPEQAIGLNDLSKNIGSSKTSTKIAVLKLIKEGFLKKEEIGKAWRITANQKHSFVTTRKISYNLGLIYESGIVNTIYKKIPNARTIVLFGSYRWGTDNEKSDIDIAVEVLSNNGLKIETLGVIEKIGLRKNVKVNLHIFSRSKIDTNLFNNIANGIILDGLLEVRP
jgi:predicted nucleotidyltransferase